MKCVGSILSLTLLFLTTSSSARHDVDKGFSSQDISQHRDLFGEGERDLQAIPPGGCCSIDGETCVEVLSRRCYTAINNRRCRKYCHPESFFVVSPTSVEPSGCCSVDEGKTCIKTRRRRCLNAKTTFHCRARCPRGEAAIYVLEPNIFGAHPTTTAPPLTSTSPPLATTEPPLPEGLCTTELAEALQSCPSGHPLCEAMLTAHNTRRCQFLTENNKPIILMHWNVTLENQSIGWANNLKQESGSDGCSFYHDTSLGKVGENLFINFGSTGYQSTPEEILEKWYTKQYEAAKNGDTSSILHFAQVAWSTTDQLGCASYSNSYEGFGTPGGMCHVMVCRYFVRTCGFSGTTWLNDVLEGDKRCSQ